MQTITAIGALRAQLKAWRIEGLRIGFVPTMGNLHAGHMSLLAAARYRADKVVASVFVNPLQFGPNEDYATYPRTPDDDRSLLLAAHCDLLFLPTVEEMYPDGASQATLVHVRVLSETLCGEFRPGHFDGVATVVAKLFEIVQPDVAVFGEKDFQQLTVIRRMATDLCMAVEVVGAATVRTPDGLAMSSRNRYLSPEDRAIAPQIHAALLAAVQRIDSGDGDYAAIEAQGAATLRAAGMRPDYFAVRDALTLTPPTPQSIDLVVLTAARLGRARLIDNLRARRR
ncbi:MAG TPA: pantoate--beta-alanine ligase [Steroidobacteraceae bacterium]|jgi:pantoate--beta-alanine ligase|nr:pantoate--beta-alanine ligase [Steroidobacteraceae bacterium]